MFLIMKLIVTAPLETEILGNRKDQDSCIDLYGSEWIGRDWIRKWLQWEWSKKKFIDEGHQFIQNYLDANDSGNGRRRKNVAYRNASMIIEFAMSMHQILEGLNRDSFQNFELRIGRVLNWSLISNLIILGMSLGPLVAGVIGAQKPQYDIWGNTVNLASRMDTHGEPSKIHVRIISIN